MSNAERVPADLMAAHIVRLCKIHDIAIGTRVSRGGRAYRKLRLIKIRPVKSAITYAVALHEIGHILGPRQNGYRIDKEVGAWEWAIANSIAWTEPMTLLMHRSLQSYIDWINRRPRMRQPGDNHPVHALMAKKE